MTKPINLVSKCCGEKVKQGGIPDFEESNKVCTRYYVCTKCGKPCDIADPIQESVEAESNEIVNYFMDKGATVSVKDYDYIKSSLLRIAKIACETKYENKISKIRQEEREKKVLKGERRRIIEQIRHAERERIIKEIKDYRDKFFPILTPDYVVITEMLKYPPFQP